MLRESELKSCLIKSRFDLSSPTVLLDSDSRRSNPICREVKKNFKTPDAGAEYMKEAALRCPNVDTTHVEMKCTD